MTIHITTEEDRGVCLIEQAREEGRKQGIEDFRQLLTEAREALQFYADEENWKEQIMDGMDYYARWKEIKEDEPGDKARAMLAKLEVEGVRNASHKV